MDDMISRQAAIDAVFKLCDETDNPHVDAIVYELESLPSAQPEYEPVKTADFAKTMSENTLYSYMAWYGEALELMKGQRFVICKKTM